MANRYYLGKYSGSSQENIRLELHIYTVATDIANNTTTERADLYMVVENASSRWYNLNPTEAHINVNANTITRNPSFDARTTGVKKLIETWDTVIAHDGDGTVKPINVSAYHKTLVGLGDASVSGTYECDTIPRYTSFTKHYISNTTLKTATINFEVANEIDLVQYSLDGGEWQVVAPYLRSYTIGGLEPDEQHTVKTRVRRKDSSLWTESNDLSFKTKNIAIMQPLNKFIIGQSTTIRYTNDGDYSITAYVEAIDSIGGTSKYEIISQREVYGNEYTFNYTAEEIQALYREIPNSTIGFLRFGIISREENSAYFSWQDVEYNIDTNINKPIFNDFNHEDKNLQVQNYTGSPYIYFKGYSNAEISIPVEKRAIGQNSATIVRYRVTIDNVSQYIENSTIDSVWWTQINGITSNVVKVDAIDSRGLETSVTKVLQWIEWWQPTVAEFEVYRENGVGTKGMINVSGKYWNGNFGIVQNRLYKVYYAYKKTIDESYSNWIEITNRFTSSDGNYSTIEEAFLPTTYNGTTPVEFEIGYEYNILIGVSDETYAMTQRPELTNILNSGIPCMDKIKNSSRRYSIGINKLADENYALSIEGGLQVDGIDVTSNTVYSTEEKRIGTWIDGKPLYRKVIAGEGATSALYIGSNIDTIVDMKANILINNGAVINCARFESNEDRFNWYYYDNFIRVYIGSAWINSTVKTMAIIEYTKTT